MIVLRDDSLEMPTSYQHRTRQHESCWYNIKIHIVQQLSLEWEIKPFPTLYNYDWLERLYVSITSMPI